MNRKWETILLIVLPVLIAGMIVYNAGIMSRIYMIENGIDQNSKIWKAKIVPDQSDITAKSGENIKLNVELLNQGSFIWLRLGSHAVHLSYHIRDGEGNLLKYDNDRYELPHDMRPNTDTRIEVEMIPDLQPGDYILEFDVVEEGVTWFGEKGSPASLINLHID